MQAVFHRINELIGRYEQRALFRLLDGPGVAAQARALVPGLTFFVFCFQDILRLNAQQITDPTLQMIARQHRAEDAGHQDWFLHDARCLGVEPDISWTFGSEHRATRDTSYRLISEVLRASDDRVRVAIPLVLEATGHVFFRRVFRFFDAAGVGARLKYFALQHWQVEEGHDMLQENQSDFLHRLELPDELRAECLAMVERVFEAMAAMVDSLHARALASNGARVAFDLDRPTSKRGTRVARA